MPSANITTVEFPEDNDSEFAALLRAEQIAFLMRQIPVLAAVNAVGSLMLLSALLNEIPATYLFIWFLAMMSVVTQQLRTWSQF